MVLHITFFNAISYGDIKHTKISGNMGEKGQVVPITVNMSLKSKNSRKSETPLPDQSDPKKFVANSDFGETDLHVAVRLGDLDEVKRLIHSGSGIDVVDSNGQTPLHIAVITNPDVAFFLVNSGANLDLRDTNGKTALHLAIHFKKHDAVKLLIAAGAKLYLTNNIGETPIDATFALLTKDPLIEDLLVKGGAVSAEMDDLFRKGQRKGTAFAFCRKIRLYNEICSYDDMEVIIKYALLYFPRINIKHFAWMHDLDAYYVELNRMRSELISVDSKITLHMLLLKEDENAWSKFIANVSLKPFAVIKAFYTDKYPIYAKMILRKLLKEKEKRLLLLKFNIVMDHSDLECLPYLVRCMLIAYLADSDLKTFIASALGESNIR